MGKASKFVSFMIIGSFIFGIILMALAEHVYEDAFGIGLFLFLFGIAISTIWGIWNSAGWMAKKIR